MIKLDQAIVLAKSLSDDVWGKLEGTKLPNSNRQRIGAALIQLSMSHYSAIVKLIEFQSVSSAFALLRPAIDGFLRSQWCLHLATDAELESFVDGNDPPNWRKICVQLRELEGTPDLLATHLPTTLWALISDFVHGGGRIAIRHIQVGDIVPQFSQEEIISVLGLARGWFLVAASAIADLGERDDLQKELEEIAARHNF